MLEKMKNAWRIPELRKKIIYTFGMLLIYRLLCVIPVPGINVSAVASAVSQLWDKYDTQYFSELLPALQDIPEEDAACMIRTIETLYQVLAERRNNVGKQ